MTINFNVELQTKCEIDAWLRVSNFNDKKKYCLEQKIPENILSNLYANLQKKVNEAQQLYKQQLNEKYIDNQVRKDQDELIIDQKSMGLDQQKKVELIAQKSFVSRSISENQVRHSQVAKQIQYFEGELTKKRAQQKPFRELIEKNERNIKNLELFKDELRSKNEAYEDKKSYLAKRRLELPSLEIKLQDLEKEAAALRAALARIGDDHMHVHVHVHGPKVVPVYNYGHIHSFEAVNDSHHHRHAPDVNQRSRKDVEELLTQNKLVQDHFRRMKEEILAIEHDQVVPAKSQFEFALNKVVNLEKEIDRNFSSVAIAKQMMNDSEIEIVALQNEKALFQQESRELVGSKNSLDIKHSELQCELSALDRRDIQRADRATQRDRRNRAISISANIQEQLSDTAFGEYSRELSDKTRELTQEHQGLKIKIAELATYSLWLQTLTNMMSSGALKSTENVAMQQVFSLMEHRKTIDQYLSDYDKYIGQVCADFNKNLEEEKAALINETNYDDVIKEFDNVIEWETKNLRKQYDAIAPLLDLRTRLVQELTTNHAHIRSFQLEQKQNNLRIKLRGSLVVTIAAISIVAMGILMPGLITIGLFVAALAVSTLGLAGIIYFDAKLRQIPSFSKLGYHTTMNELNEKDQSIRMQLETVNPQADNAKVVVDRGAQEVYQKICHVTTKLEQFYGKLFDKKLDKHRVGALNVVTQEILDRKKAKENIKLVEQQITDIIEAPFMSAASL